MPHLTCSHVATPNRLMRGWLLAFLPQAEPARLQALLLAQGLHGFGLSLNSLCDAPQTPKSDDSMHPPTSSTGFGIVRTQSQSRVSATTSSMQEFRKIGDLDTTLKHNNILNSGT